MKDEPAIIFEIHEDLDDDFLRSLFNAENQNIDDSQSKSQSEVQPQRFEESLSTLQNVSTPNETYVEVTSEVTSNENANLCVHVFENKNCLLQSSNARDIHKESEKIIVDPKPDLNSTNDVVQLKTLPLQELNVYQSSEKKILQDIGNVVNNCDKPQESVKKFIQYPTMDLIKKKSKNKRSPMSSILTGKEWIDNEKIRLEKKKKKRKGFGTEKKKQNRK